MRCAASTSTSTPANSSCCSARRAAASRRCSISSAASTSRRAGTVHFRDHDLTGAERSRADALPARARRLRVPVLQPDSEPDRARERRAGDRHRRASDGAEEALALVGLGERLRPFSVAALGRRAAARRDRARHREAARGAACATSRPARSTTRPASSCSRSSRASTRELGTTTIVITHNAAIAGMADRVCACRRPHRRRRKQSAQARAVGAFLVTAAPRPQAAARPVVAQDPGGVDRLVVACGIGGFIGRCRRTTSLLLTREQYYDSARFAHVFAEVKRAPELAGRAIRYSGRVRGRDARGARRAARRAWRRAADERARDRHAGGTHRDAALPQAMNRLSLKSGRWPPPAPGARWWSTAGSPKCAAGTRQRDPRAAQWQARAPHRRGHGAFAGIHFRHSRRRAAGRRMVRHHLDGRQAAGRGVQHGRRVQLGCAAPRRRSRRRRRPQWSPNSTGCSSPMARCGGYGTRENRSRTRCCRRKSSSSA